MMSNRSLLTGRLHVEPKEIHLWRIPLVMGSLNNTLFLPLNEEQPSVANPQQRGLLGMVVPCDMTRHYQYYCRARQAILAQYTDTAPRIQKTPSGKPYLVGNSEGRPVVFSTSHTEGMACIAVAQRGSVGVDIELRDTSLDYTRVAQLYLSPVEQEWVFSHAQECVASAFLRMWTLKESYRKWIGLGEQHLAWNEFSVEPTPFFEAKGLWQCKGSEKQLASCMLMEVSIAAGYVASLATTTENPSSPEELPIILHETASFLQEKIEDDQ